MSEQNTNMYTLPVEYAFEQLMTADEQILISKDLMKDFLSSEDKKHNLLIPLLVESMWANFSILKILELFMEDPVIENNPDTGEEEYVLSEGTLQALQVLVVNRHYINRDLSKYSFYMGLH